MLVILGKQFPIEVKIEQIVVKFYVIWALNLFGVNALIVIDVVLKVTDRILFRLNRELQFLTFLVVILKAQKTQESILLVEVSDERHLYT